jgi:hypothetical protein
VHGAVGNGSRKMFNGHAVERTCIRLPCL